MKRKATVGIIAIIILICSIVIFRSIYIQRSYYPMGGEVTILAKQADNYGYYITVEQGKPDDAGWGQFELKCTQEQYEAVDVGDVVKCDREQSIVTNSGTVHKNTKKITSMDKGKHGFDGQKCAHASSKPLAIQAYALRAFPRLDPFLLRQNCVETETALICP